MIIKILGTGCANCEKLEKNLKKAIEELGINASIEKVADLKTIVSYGVMTSPALVVNEKVKVKGRVPKVDELKKIIEES